MMGMPQIRIDWTISAGQIAVTCAGLLTTWIVRKVQLQIRHLWGEHLVIKDHVMRHERITKEEFETRARDALRKAKI